MRGINQDGTEVRWNPTSQPPDLSGPVPLVTHVGRPPQKGSPKRVQKGSFLGSLLSTRPLGSTSWGVPRPLGVWVGPLKSLFLTPFGSWIQGPTQCVIPITMFMGSGCRELGFHPISVTCDHQFHGHDHLGRSPETMVSRS